MKKKIERNKEAVHKLLEKSTFHKALAVKLLALSVGLVLLAGLSNAHYFTSRVSIQYKGISQGINPDGTRFDTNLLVSEPVIQEVFTAAKLTYEPEALKQFEVYPVLPQGIVNTIKQKREKGEPYTYFPNEFEIRVKPKLFGGIDFLKAQKLSKVYHVGYETYFKKVYQYPFVNLENTFGNFEYTEYDYPEVAKVFENEYKLLISYLSVLMEEDPNYRSDKGLSFQDIVATLNASKTLDLDRVSANISAHNLTKNKEMLILKYEYMIRRYDLEKGKDYGEYAISKDLLSILKTKENGVVMPSIAGTPITVKSVDESYDALAQKFNNALVKAGDKTEDVKYLQKEIDRLKRSKYTDQQLSVVYKEVDQMIKELDVKLDNWIKIIKEIADAYFEKKYGNAVKLTSKSRLSSLPSIKMIFIEIVFIWVLLMGLAAFWKKQSVKERVLESSKGLYKHFMQYVK